VNGGARPAAVALLSAGTLAFEVLLVRAFAIEQFHHFAYMTIGVAMLGYGAAGTLLALLRWPGAERGAHWFRAASLLTPLSLVASVTVVHRVSLDPTQLPWDPAQWPRLVLVYALLALPFAFGALAILIAITLERSRTGRIYGAGFLGAGLGSALALATLWALSPERALAVPALLAAFGAICASLERRGVARRLPAVATLLLATAVLVQPAWRFRITPFKGLPQVEAYPGAHRLGEYPNPVGWVVTVEAPSFRHAPGLSLAFTGSVPPQTALFVDGELAGAVAARGDGADRALLDWLPSALPYALRGRDRVLILGAGGGTEVRNALAHGARAVKAVELHPVIARLAGSRGGDSAAVAEGRPGRVEWVVGDARSFMSRSRERFDLVSLSTGQAFGTSAAGVHALSEDFLHTVDGYIAYLEHLSDDGVLAVTRWLSVPARENVRVILTAAEALRRTSPDALDAGLLVVRSWATVTTLLKPSGFSGLDIERLAEWARSRRFDLDWYPGITSPESTFNFIDDPVLYRAAAAAVSGPEQAARFASAYPFDVAPSSDARPYPHHFLRWNSLTDFLAGGRGSWLPFAEWGYIALLATLLQSALLAGLLMVLPAAIRSRASGAGGLPRVVGYFTAIGFAYLAAEIAAIQQLNLLLGHPVFAVAAVLTAFLVFSGAGSIWSDAHPALGVRLLAFGIAAALALFAATLLPVIHRAESAPFLVRGGVGLLSLAPLAFAMGMPFPVGLRALVPDDARDIAAWAWAANGFASTVAAPLAALIALEAGSPTLFLAAAAAYAGAGLLGRGRGPRNRPGMVA
jgi:hypothetical protein